MNAHEVLRGDCLELLPGFLPGSFDAVITDPPYNTGLTQKTQVGRRLDANRPVFDNGSWLGGFFNDSYAPEEYERLVNEWSKAIYRVLKDDAPLYLFINWKSYPIWHVALSQAGFTIKNLIVWDKEVHGLNYQNYAYRHEFLIFAVKGSFLPLMKTSHYTDVWRFKRRLGGKMNEYEHETVKPVELLSEIVVQSTRRNDLILDPFGGSGTTAVAAKLNGRRSITIELREDYVTLSRKRLDDTTEQKKLVTLTEVQEE